MAALALSGCLSPGSGHGAKDSTSTGPAEVAGGSSAPAPSAKATPATGQSSDGLASGDLLGIKCTKDSTGSWSFEGDVKNSSTRQKTFTVAVAVTVGSAVKGHALLTQTVAAGSLEHVAAPDFAESNDPAAACEPVASVVG